MMQDVQHPNVLPVVGVCLTASDDPLVVLPYSEHRDIKAYIRQPSKVSVDKKVTIFFFLNLIYTVVLDICFCKPVIENLSFLKSHKSVNQNMVTNELLIIVYQFTH